MAVVVTIRTSGLHAEKYETVLRRLEAAGAGAPRGRLHHVSFGNREDLTMVDVFEDLETHAAFSARLLAILGELGVTVHMEAARAYKVIRV